MSCDRCGREPVYRYYFGYCPVCFDYLTEMGELRSHREKRRGTDGTQTTL